MRFNVFVFGVLILLLLTSCYATKYTYSGNIHEQSIGKTKNEILREYGVPDKTDDDGAGGKIMIYEKITQVTTTNAGASSYERGSAYGGVIYGNGYGAGGVESRSGQVSSMNATTQSTTNKQFVNIFLNKNDVAYDYRSNYGAKFNMSRCFSPKLTWSSVAISAIVWPALFVTVPLAIIKHVKAKKNNEICK
jgi:hypothetical protein